MSLTRRGFLRRCLLGSSLGGVGAPLLGACSSEDVTRLELDPTKVPWPLRTDGSPFAHGVASGDPSADGVVLWTRVSAPGAAAVAVEWRVASDADFSSVVAYGVARAEAEQDHTVHVEVAGLRSGTTYYYQFRSDGRGSPIGRTRTLPDAQVSHMRLGVASCSNFPAGFFNAYALMARADVDLVLHVGDYIYEHGNASFGDGAPIGRVPDPDREIVSLDDYRRRHAQYKLDPDLQELHRQHVCVTIWDDHEVVDDGYVTGAAAHRAQAGDYIERKTNALRAYREWMPLRQGADATLIYRSFTCGDLLDLVMLDTRYRGRDPILDRCDSEGFSAPGRQLLGAEQERWLEDTLARSQARGARWRLIGQQVIFAPLVRSLRGCVHDPDMWDGYASSRERVFDVLERHAVDNVVVLTGDAHSSWAMEVPRDPFDPGAYDAASGRGSRLVEFVVPAVSSPGRGLPVQEILESHPHVKFTEQQRHGFLIVDVQPERVQAEWYFVETVRERSLGSELGSVWKVRAGEARLEPSQVSASRSGGPRPAG